MTLRDVAAALERMKAATLTQLAAELEAPPREVEPLLDFWERRGTIRRCADSLTGGCGSTCRACPLAQRRPSVEMRTPPQRTAVVYEWVGGSHPAARASRRQGAAADTTADPYGMLHGRCVAPVFTIHRQDTYHPRR